MLYSRIEEGTSCYVNLHAEEVLNTLRQPEGAGYMGTLEPGGMTVRPLLELAEDLTGVEQLILDFENVEGIAKEAEEELGTALATLTERTKVCLLHMAPSVKTRLQELLAEQGMPAVFMDETVEADEPVKFGETAEADEPVKFGETVGADEPVIIGGADLEALASHIKQSNFNILMENGAQGRYFDIPRLLADGELCMYYFFYCLARKMLQRGLIPDNAADREKLCIVPGNEQALPMAKELAKLTGTDVISVYPSAGELKKNREYIIVRDVIHMCFELDGLKAAAVNCGAQIKGAVCLLDIRTGIGDCRHRVSLHTIDLEEGISYHREQAQR